MQVYCFDFDGVICDSAPEMARTAWLAATELWPNLAQGDPGPAHIERFCRLRPVIETGYESILLTRMMRESMPEEQIVNNFPGLAKMLVSVLDLSIDKLIEHFASLRDRQIEADLNGWLANHELYEGTVETINRLSARQGAMTCIVTTKQQRYAKAIAAAAGLAVQPQFIFGLEAGKKSAVLGKLLRHPKLPGATFHFFEDRLASLEKLAEDPTFATLNLYYCTWGYTTEAERSRAATLPRLHSLTLAEFNQRFREIT